MACLVVILSVNGLCVNTSLEFEVIVGVAEIGERERWVVCNADAGTKPL